MRDELGRVLLEYPAARQRPLTDHPLAHHLTHDLADEVRERVDSDSYKVTGSPEEATGLRRRGSQSSIGW